ncbi:MAG: VTT domain-containing protein [Dehalococcoidales bacterium]|nr:VTT domain-containing protein [Dehalococcoidales bacterium]
MEQETKKNSPSRTVYIVGIVGAVLTVVMAFAVVYYSEWLRELSAYGYVGAFLISILGGATIIVPVPMLAVVFALGGVMPHTWLVGLAAGLGETIGALIIYVTGYGGLRAFGRNTKGLVARYYEKLLLLMEKRGSLTLFVLAAVINPFFYPAALAAGALRFGIRKYFIICFIGKTIKGMSIVYFGYWGVRELLQLFGIRL